MTGVAKKIGVLLVMLALAACASGDDDKKADASADKHPVKTRQAKLNTDNLICPQVAILTEAQTHADYGGENPDKSQLVAAAHMESIDGDCGYRDNGSDSGIDITYTLHIVAQRGPRLGGDQTGFPFFVALIDPHDNIVSRQALTAQFHFSGKDMRASDDEALHIFIPLTKDGLQAGPDYRVLMGFRK